MAPDKLDLLGPAMTKIGEEACQIVGGQPDRIFLYVEIGEGWVEPSLFKDEGEVVRYFDIDDSPIWRSIIAAWRLEPSDRRWSAMHYTIEEGRFDAIFDFGDLDRPGEDYDDRRERILNARYGGKPRVYPPLSSEAVELTSPS